MLQRLRCLPQTSKAKEIFEMKGDIDSDVSVNDANSSARSDSDSEAHFDSSARNDGRGENEIAVLGHELLILEDHDEKEDDYNNDDENSKRLSLTGDSENWLHIRAAPLPRLKYCIEKKAVATATSMRSSPHSSQVDEKKEEHQVSSWGRSTENTNRYKKTSEPIMQTQEPSPTQKTPTQMQTQMQTQTQTQETETQQSIAMSLLAYLNQPSQDSNEEVAMNADKRPDIEILSGDELLALCSVSKSSPLSTQYPPSDSAFLCFEELSTPGAAQISYVTVKDMRPPNPRKNPNSMEEDGDVVAEIDLLRADRAVSVGWKPLQRRRLIVLCPGDRIRITIMSSRALQATISTNRYNRLLANITIVLEYRHTQTSRKQKPKCSLPTPMSEKNFAERNNETDIKIDFNGDGGSKTAEKYGATSNDKTLDDSFATTSKDKTLGDGYATTSKHKTLDDGDKHLNTFCGSTRREAGKKMRKERIRMPPRDISSNRRDFHTTFDSTIFGESAIDSNASVAVDSTVNSQQESLRSSRMELLDRNRNLGGGGGGNVEVNEAGIQNTNVVKRSPLPNGSDQGDGKDSHDNIRNNLVKEKEENENKADDDSSDAAILDHNNHEPEDSKAEKNSNDRDQVDDSSATINPNCFTQETTDPSVDKTSNDEHESDDSSGATIPLYYTQEADYTATDKNLNDEDEKDDGQSKLNSNRNAAKKDYLTVQLRQQPEEDTESIPRNIEIEDDDQEDGGKPPVSQLLLSMEIDNEGEDDREDENGASQSKCNIQEEKHVPPAQQKLQVCKINATNKAPVSNIEKKTGVKVSTGTEMRQSEDCQQKTSDTKDIGCSVQQETSETKDNVPTPSDAVACDKNKDFNNTVHSVARDTKADRIEKESDDETVLGTDIIMHNTVNSSMMRETGIDTLQYQNCCHGGGNNSTSAGESNSSSAEGIDSRIRKCTVNQEPAKSNRIHKTREKWTLSIDRDSQEWAIETDDRPKMNTSRTTMTRKSTALNTEPNLNHARTTQESNSSDIEAIKNSATEKPLSVATTSEEIVRPEQRKISTSESTRNVACYEKSAICEVGNVTDCDRRDGTRSNRRSTIKRKAVACSNQDATGNASTRPSGPSKRRRTLAAKNDRSKNDLIAARTADELYEKRFNLAIEKKMVNIVVSGFPQNEMVHITKLCKTKLLNVTQLKINETIDKNTTACVLPIASNDREEASCRTLKAIRCALLGIPMVPLAWVECCKKEQKVTIPSSYIRTLSSKIGTLTMKDHARYGVARLAAARCQEPQNPLLPFQNAFVFLCGKYSSDKKNIIIKLLEEGCACLVTSWREASAKLKSVMDSSDELSLPPKRFVLLFGDRGNLIPKSLQKEIMTALEDSKSRKIYVVDSNWVSLSIACANMLPPADFKPKDGVELWRLSKDLPE
jgi:hypothetical protein